MSDAAFRRALGPGRWASVDVLEYKAEASARFREVSRQVLFSRPELACELRYFEVAAGGHTTLERHEHVHGVMILRGHGACLVGRTVRAVGPQDLIEIPPSTWHQFRATESEPLGFLCMVNAARDRPRLPTAQEVEEMCGDAKVAAFIRV